MKAHTATQEVPAKNIGLAIDGQTVGELKGIKGPAACAYRRCSAPPPVAAPPRGVRDLPWA
jgi:hypothetical protein